MGEPSAHGRVLIVCRANVCRSPTAALLLRRRLSSSSRIEVVTAGWRPAPDDGWCAEMRRRVEPGDDAEALAAGHSPRLANLETLQTADLVLAADRRSRAELARQAPRQTFRLFTLIEAAHLMAAVPHDEKVRWKTIADLVGRLDVTRGTVPLPKAAASRLPWRIRSGIDLPDAHSETQPATHPWLARHLDEVTTSLAADLCRLLG